MAVISVRRFYLLKAQAAEAVGDEGLAGVWRWKQLQVTSLALPALFPYLTSLVAAGYLAKDDIIGADAAELRRVAGIPNSGALAAIAAAPLIV